MNISYISQELTKYIKEETIQLINLIFDDNDINAQNPGLSEKKNDIIEKYFKQNMVENTNKQKDLETINTNQCIALLRNKKQCSNKKSKNSHYCTRHSKIRKFGEISLS